MQYENIDRFIESIEIEKNRNRMVEVLNYIKNKFPNLKQEFKWSQPMFTMDGTFIIGFSVAKNHMSIAPEYVCLHHFSDYLDEHKIEYSKMLAKIPWDKDFNYELLDMFIEFNMEDKKGLNSFWRK